MHEFGIVASALEIVETTARENKANKVTHIELNVGEMVEAVEESLQFAFEALSVGTIAEGAVLTVHTLPPRSRCLDCLTEYEHDRFQVKCPACQSIHTTLLSGKELEVSTIELDIV